MTPYHSIFFCLTVFFLNVDVAFSQGRPKDKILSKRDFEIIILPSEGKELKEDTINDVLSFRSDKAWSHHLQSQSNGGFIRGKYVVLKKEKSDDGTTYFFQAINKNQKGMSLKWEGQVFKDQIKGTAIISKKGKIKQQFAFSGTEQY